MAAVPLRKVWGSVYSRSGSSSIRSWTDLPDDQPPLGDFDLIPTDVFLQILRLLGPWHAARSSSVCKSWKALVFDNSIWVYFLKNSAEPWDSLAFAETQLSSGQP